jgi:signal transduction histidine kinase
VRGLNVAASLGYLGYRLVAASGTMPSTSLLLRAGFLLLLNAFFIGAAWFYGNAVAARREYETQLVQRAAQLERERDINARQAVLRERVRVARDLHDVVAHHVSLIGIQAAAARRGLPQEPDRAVAGLRAIEQSSRDGLQELHRMLGLLRQPDEEADGVAGQPTVQDVPALIEAVRGTALHVDLERVGEGRPVPAEVGTSAYRIIQEALTNTIRHSNARQAHVVVAVFDDHLELEVRDDGAPVRTGAGTEGQGLRGMRERAALAGGVVEAGPLPERGYRVSASLPLFAGRA